MVCDMSKLCECPSLDSCQKRFLWSHKEVDLSLHPAAGLRGVEKFPQALDLKSLDPFLRVSKQGPGLIAIEVYLQPACTMFPTDFSLQNSLFIQYSPV